MTASAGAAGAWAGIAIAEDVEGVATAVRNRDWVDGTLAAAGGALDGLSLAVDPVGNLLQYGVAWLIEHVEPLSEALGWLAGDAAGIATHAAAWRDVAATLTARAEDLSRAASSQVADWGGTAGEAYRAWIGRRTDGLRTLGTAAGTMAAITEDSGGLVGSVRLMVRDAVAAVVGRLITYAVEILATAGAATPVVVAPVAALCATWAGRIGRWLKSLIGSLRRLLAHSDRLAALLGRPAGGPGAATGTGRAPAGKAGPASGFEQARGASGGAATGTGTGAEREPVGNVGPASGFDAGSERGPLAAGFRSGVEDSANLFSDKERAIADRLAADGEMVHPRRRVDDVTGLKNPDAMVRGGPGDPGVVTEFKTPETASSSSVRANILAAGKQVDQHGGGAVVLDGRVAGLTAETARQGYARAAGHAREHGSPLPERIRVILADGTMLDIP